LYLLRLCHSPEELGVNVHQPDKGAIAVGAGADPAGGRAEQVAGAAQERRLFGSAVVLGGRCEVVDEAQGLRLAGPLQGFIEGEGHVSDESSWFVVST
jgi:hypothetical protein